MTSEELDRKKFEIEIMLTEYEQALAAAAEWYRAWRERQQRFRCQRDSASIVS